MRAEAGSRAIGAAVCAAALLWGCAPERRVGAASAAASPPADAPVVRIRTLPSATERTASASTKLAAAPPAGLSRRAAEDRPRRRRRPRKPRVEAAPPQIAPEPPAEVREPVEPAPEPPVVVAPPPAPSPDVPATENGSDDSGAGGQ